MVSDTLVGVGLRKSVLPLLFLKFPWAALPFPKNLSQEEESIVLAGSGD